MERCAKLGAIVKSNGYCGYLCMCVVWWGGGSWYSIQHLSLCTRWCNAELYYVSALWQCISFELLHCWQWMEFWWINCKIIYCLVCLVCMHGVLTLTYTYTHIHAHVHASFWDKHIHFVAGQPYIENATILFDALHVPTSCGWLSKIPFQ